MGKLFVIDGTDGSGKQTQSSLLKERLQKDGIDFKSISFPNYDSPSAALVKMYLEGKSGENQKDVSPYIASTFYAADRYVTFKKDFEGVRKAILHQNFSFKRKTLFWIAFYISPYIAHFFYTFCR